MSTPKHQLVLTRPGFAGLLVQEFQDLWQLLGKPAGTAAVAFDEHEVLPALDATVFGRQYLPRATCLQIESIEQVVGVIVKRLETLSNRANRHAAKWTLHSFAQDDDPALQLASKIEKALLASVRQRLPRLFQRYITPAQAQSEFVGSPGSSGMLVQIYLPSLTELWFSAAGAGTGPSIFIAGNQRMRHFPGAPSRSSSKLEEAFVVLGRPPQAGEIAVDLGAAPGGWTFTLVRHGATVTAVDHGALMLPKDKKFNERVTHLLANGLTYKPSLAVDWVTCDMLVGPRETLRVLERWLEDGLARNFVFNVKLPQAQPWPVIKEALSLLSRYPWAVMKAKHLYHDRQEITLMGCVLGNSTEATSEEKSKH